MEIRVFKPPLEQGEAFEILGITEKCSSITLVENFYSPGIFSLSIPVGEVYSDTFRVGNIIVANGAFIGQIDTVNMTADNSGRFIGVSGVDIKGLASRVLCLPPGFTDTSGTVGLRVFAGKTETILKNLWRENITAPPQNWRKPVYGLTVAADQMRGANHPERSIAADMNVSEVTAELGRYAKLGMTYQQDLQNGKIILDVRSGINRTGHQNENDPVIFSFDRRTLKTLTREISEKAYCNLFVAASAEGQFNDGLFIAASPADAGGWERREQFLSVDVTNPNSAVALISEINSKRYAYDKTDKIEIDIDPVNYLYRRDFQLGDYCTVQDEDFDIETDLQIVSVTTTVSAESVTYKIGAGMDKTTAFGVLRRMIMNGR